MTITAFRILKTVVALELNETALRHDEAADLTGMQHEHG